MKKKIIFIMPSMFMGGAERSLIGILNTIDYEKYEVSLFLYRHEGEFLRLIPPQVKILPLMEEYETFDVPIKKLLFSKKWKYGMARILAKIYMKIHCIRTHERAGVWMAMQYISKALLSYLPQIPGKYDLGISFLGIPDVLIEKIDAEVKVAWNHTDYSILNPDKKRDKEIYSQIDYIVSVSEMCTCQFKKVYPEFARKAITIENLLNIELLTEQAKKVIYDMPRNGHKYILLSIGRYSDAKNFDNIPTICKIIREMGVDIIWYIIGYGAEERLIRQRIEEEKMEEFVILLGKRSNPYPYIKKCDIYVQPSRYEGKAVTVREAQILQKPVVITNFPTAYSQLRDDVDGIIVPMDNRGCAEGITELILNKQKRNRLIENCRKTNYSNLDELEKLYMLMKD
ncbi:colanic acid biosynthesis glycosyltransferase WcaL [uncultured Ruminococcus sp.]|nr:colanic acid biosynthesis glycosyltransferase WcaL [uncultured Ruminococcus sp.]